MNEEQALLRAIFDNPEEDTPRLMIADWYEEHDKPIRARAIREAITYARPGPERFEAEKVLFEIKRDHGTEDWCGVDDATYRLWLMASSRGFVNEIKRRITLAEFETECLPLFLLHPIEWVHFRPEQFTGTRRPNIHSDALWLEIAPAGVEPQAPHVLPHYIGHHVGQTHKTWVVRTDGPWVALNGATAVDVFCSKVFALYGRACERALRC